MDELGAQLNDFIAFADGVDAAAYSAGGLEEGDTAACFGESTGCGESGHAGSDDENVGWGGHFGLDAADNDLKWLARRMVQVSFYTDSMGAVVTFNFP